ncbi:MAG TPA: amino acid adenylation domain-containing protein [Pyrinomonadaceae bacterium]
MDSVSKQVVGASPEEKRILLASLLRKKAQQQSRTYPLSFAQERLWFIDQLIRDSSLYNLPAAVRLTGRLNPQALEMTMTEICRRHTSLTTTFPTIEGQPVQMVNPAQPVSLPVLDLRSWNVEEREVEAQRLVNLEARKPFNLATGPLLRVQLLQLEEEEFIVMLSMHHIIADGWSMDILIREIMVLYQAMAAGKPSPLPELPLQYADYARWQRQYLRGEMLEAQLSYWQKQLDGIPPLLELPADHPRPPEQSYRGTTRSLMLSPELSEALRSLSRREETTLFNVLLTGFKTLLFRYTWQNDICVGTPVAGRDRVEAEGLIGFFANVLVLRTKVSGKATFRELLRHVHEVCLEAHTHQDVPFEKLVEALHPERNMSYSPLFQVMFAFLNAGQTVLEIPGLKMSGYGAVQEAAKYDLLLGVMDLRERLAISLEYSTDLFESERIERMLLHFRSLLESVVVDPGQQLVDIPLLQESEREQILVEWNRSSAEYPEGASMHQLFERCVDEQGEAVALVFGKEQISYRELEERTNQVGHYLQSLGVGPETLVAVCLERTIEMVVTLLGILKAGGAYLPLDASYPAERLRYMLSDSEAKLLVTSVKTEALSGTNVPVLYVEELAEQVAGQSRARVDSEVGPENLAYVIYTSGSTGQPKGVMISHGGLVNYLYWGARSYGLSGAKQEQGMGAVLHSSISFDLSITSLWGPLVAGKSVELVAEEQGVEGLLERLRQRGPYGVVKLTPSHLMILNQQLAAEELGRSAKVVVLGGENLGSEQVRVWRKQAPGVRLINEYGPTETVVGCCVYEVTEETSWEGAVPIGRPIANTQMYVLDRELEPVAVGVVGEIYIGGVGVARGYLRRPELTAEKFVPHPFAAVGGERLYRTGDLGRYGSDGELEFLGRLDEQVKVRGYRIELGEIESVLRASEGVQEAVVIVEEREGEKRLVGYVVPEAGAGLLVERMRAQLREQLPEYMVPAVFMELDKLPLTANGKVNRRALLELGVPKLERQKAFTAPRNTLEIALAKLWEELLGITPIGITDNFFDLGGSSLLAVRMVALVEKQFGKDVPLTTLFKGATIEFMAEVLSEEDQPQPWSPLVPIQPLGSKSPFFCVHAVGGQVLTFYHLARHLGQDQPFYGIQAPALFEIDDESTSIEQMAAQYVQAVRVLQPVGPYLLGGFSFGGTVAFEMACQLEKQGQQVSLLAVMDTHSPLFMHRLPEDDEVHQLVGLAWVTARQKGKYLELDPEVLRRLEPEERLNYFLEQMKDAELTPHDVEISLLRRFLVGYSARQRAQRKYFPQYSFAGSVTLFRCEEEDQETIKMMERAGVDAQDPAYGWSGYSAGPVDIHWVPGHHDRMCEEPYVQGLAAALQASLERAQLSGVKKETEEQTPNSVEHRLRARLGL